MLIISFFVTGAFSNFVFAEDSLPNKEIPANGSVVNNTNASLKDSSTINAEEQKKDTDTSTTLDKNNKAIDTTKKDVQSKNSNVTDTTSVQNPSIQTKEKKVETQNKSIQPNTHNEKIDNHSNDNNGFLKLTLLKESTGTAPFDKVPEGDAGKEYVPGLAFSPSDKYVRTNDIVSYNITLAANLNPGITDIDNVPVIITATLQDSNNASWDSKNLDNTTTISNDGKTLTRNINALSSSLSSLTLYVKALPSAKNDSSFKATIKAETPTMDSSSITTNTSIISAAPRVDVGTTKNGYPSYSRFAYGPNKEPGQVIYQDITLKVANSKGFENISGPVTFTCDLSQLNKTLPGAKLYNFTPEPCVSKNGEGIVSLPNIPYGVSDAGVLNSNTTNGTGDISAVQPKGAGGNVDITIDNLNLSSGHFPTESLMNTPLPVNNYYVFAGTLALWIPDNSFKHGYNQVDLSFNNLKLKSISDVEDFNGKPEDLTNNESIYSIVVRPAGSPAATGRIDFIGDVYGKYLPTMSEPGSRDGVIYPNENFAVECHMQNTGAVDVNKFYGLFTFDPKLMQLMPIDGKDPIKSKIAYTIENLSEDSTFNPDDLIVQYAITDYKNINDAIKDTNVNVKWYDDINEAKAAGPVGKVRISFKDNVFEVKSNFYCNLNVQAKDNPAGTKLPVFIKFRSPDIPGFDNTYPKYEDNLLDLYNADVVTMGILQADVKSSIEKVKTATDEGNDYAPGSLADISIMPSLSTPYLANGIDAKQDVTITQTLPKNVVFSNMVSSEYGNPIIEKKSDGTTLLTWNLKNVTLNSAIPTLKFKVYLAVDIPLDQDLLFNTTINNKLDTRALNYRTSSFSIKVPKKYSWKLIKNTLDNDNNINDAFLMGLNDTFSYTSEYKIFDNVDNTKFEGIEILPFNGDHTGSHFHGTYTLEGLDFPKGTELYVAKTPIVDEENLSFDQLNSKLSFEKFDSNTMKGEEFTAVKFINNNTSNQDVYSYKVTLKAHNNSPGDTYGINTLAQVPTLGPSVLSNTVEFKAVSSTIEGYIWNDKNKDGKMDNNEPGIANIPVKLLQNNNEVLDSNGKPITSVTDKNGYYSFSALNTGEYTVSIDTSKLEKPNENLLETYYYGLKDPILSDKIVDNIHINLPFNSTVPLVNFGFIHSIPASTLVPANPIKPEPVKPTPNAPKPENNPNSGSNNNTGSNNTGSSEQVPGNINNAPSNDIASTSSNKVQTTNKDDSKKQLNFKLPQTGQSALLISCGIGVILLVCGLLLSKKRK